jgi:hypothetical protein
VSEINLVIIKLHRCSAASLEDLSTRAKVIELWNVECWDVKKPYSDVLKQRCIESGEKVFHILAETFEAKLGKRREDSRRERPSV